MNALDSMTRQIGREPPRSVVVVMLSALGDAVRVLPVVSALKRAWPETRLTWILEELPYRLVRGHAAVDAFLVVPRRRPNLVGWLREVHRIVARESYDLLLDLQVGLKAGLVTSAVQARLKLGFDRARARDGNWLFTDRRIPPRPLRHVQEQYFEFLELLGVAPYPIAWDLVPTAEERDAQRAFFAGLGRSCAVAVGTSSPRKDWAADRYARLLEWLEGERGFRTVLVGGPSVGEREIARRVLDATSARPLHTLGDDVRRLLWLIDGADLAISPDSAPLHIAVAVGTPAVGLFGATNPKRYGPSGRYADLVVDGYARWPGEVYPESGRVRPGGMERVSVEAVMEKVDAACARYLPARSRERAP